MDTSRRWRSLALVAAVALALVACGDDMSAEETAELRAQALAAEGDVERGRAIFVEEASPTCASCHGLADAGTTAGVGPDLDRLQPDVERVVQALLAGPGRMPSYAGHLDAQQMADVAAYVAEVTAAQ